MPPPALYPPIDIGYTAPLGLPPLTAKSPATREAAPRLPLSARTDGSAIGDLPATPAEKRGLSLSPTASLSDSRMTSGLLGAPPLFAVLCCRLRRFTKQQ